MVKMIKWPSIEQFRNVVRNVQRKASFTGLDSNGEATYNNLCHKPVLKFEGTVKLHGTNAAVAREIRPQTSPELWCQSRENIITPEKDNAGFAMFVKANKDAFNDLLVTSIGVVGLPEAWKLPYIVVFGEWCGGSIQSGVALNQLPKMFVIFGIALVDEDSNKAYLTRQQVIDVCDGCREYVLRTPVSNADGSIPSGIYCIFDFPTFTAQIDFENPHEIVNELNLITEKVGDECPVGRAFGVSGIGEGVVWRCVTPGYEDSGFWFKVKDERHSKSKVKTLATVDVEKINGIQALAETVAHEGRLQQQFDLVFDTLNGGEADIKKTGEFIKAVMGDIFKEEIDVIAASGFTGKDVNGPVSKIVRDFLMRKLEV